LFGHLSEKWTFIYPLKAVYGHINIQNSEETNAYHLCQKKLKQQNTQKPTFTKLKMVFSIENFKIEILFTFIKSRVGNRFGMINGENK
jgi:hypothetical protein